MEVKQVKKQHMLEYVLDHQEVLKEIEKTDKRTISCRTIDVENLKNRQIGQVYACLARIDCIERYQARYSFRVRPETLDLERLDRLADLFTPDRTLKVGEEHSGILKNEGLKEGEK